MPAPTKTKKTKNINKAKKTKNMKRMKKTKTNVRVATWNLGTLNNREADVVEMLSRQQVDICGGQEHGFMDPQVLTLMGKDCKFKFFFCA